MLEAMQAAQATGRPALLAACLRLLWGPIALHLTCSATIPRRLAEPLCTAIMSLGGAVASGAAAVAGSPRAAGGSSSSQAPHAGCGCPGAAAGMHSVAEMAEVLADVFTHSLVKHICASDAWWELPPEQAHSMLQAVAAAAATCGPAPGCPACCLHPLHGIAASLLRSLHLALDTHLEMQRSSLSDAQYTRLVRTTCTAAAAALDAAHNLFDGMLASPAAAAQVTRDRLGLLIDVYFSCRHISEVQQQALPTCLGGWHGAATLLERTAAGCTTCTQLPVMHTLSIKMLPPCGLRLQLVALPPADYHALLPPTVERHGHPAAALAAVDTLSYEVPLPPITAMEGMMAEAGASAFMSSINRRNPRTGDEYPNRLQPRRLLPEFLQASGQLALQLSSAMTALRAPKPARAGVLQGMRQGAAPAGEVRLHFCDWHAWLTHPAAPSTLFAAAGPHGSPHPQSHAAGRAAHARRAGAHHLQLSQVHAAAHHHSRQPAGHFLRQPRGPLFQTLPHGRAQQAVPGALA